MPRTSLAGIAILLLALAACGSPQEDEYWVDGDGGGPVIIHGVEPEGATDILEIPGRLRYEAESGCYLLEPFDAATSGRKTLVWHMETEPVVDGERVGVTVTDHRGTVATFWDGDILAGVFGVPSSTLDDLGVCTADEAISVLGVSDLSQEELQESIAQASPA